MKTDLIKRIFPRLSPETVNPEDEEKALADEVLKKKARADHLEKMAKLRKDIAESDKRIKAAKEPFDFRNKKVLIIAGIVIIVLFVFVKSCGG